jgi:hypothetical protein
MFYISLETACLAATKFLASFLINPPLPSNSIRFREKNTLLQHFIEAPSEKAILFRHRLSIPVLLALILSQPSSFLSLKQLFSYEFHFSSWYEIIFLEKTFKMLFFVTRELTECAIHLVSSAEILDTNFLYRERMYVFHVFANIIVTCVTVVVQRPLDRRIYRNRFWATAW